MERVEGSVERVEGCVERWSGEGGGWCGEGGGWCGEGGGWCGEVEGGVERVEGEWEEVERRVNAEEVHVHVLKHTCTHVCGLGQPYLVALLIQLDIAAPQAAIGEVYIGEGPGTPHGASMVTGQTRGTNGIGPLGT